MGTVPSTKGHAGRGGRFLGERRCSRFSAVLGILLASLFVARVSPAAGVNPERVDDNVCYTPYELRGVRGHLLFGYTVSAEGRVGNVRLAYDHVEPEKDRGQLINALAGCINAWSFRPGTKDGHTAEFYLLVPFHFFKPAPEGDPEVPIPGGRTIGRSRIREMYEEKLLLAEKLLAGRAYSRAEGKGWVLRTDVPSKFAADLRKALKVAPTIFDAVFPAAPPIPDDVPVEIVLFRDVYDYSLVVAFDNLLPGSSVGSARYSHTDHTIYAAVGAKPPTIFTEMVVHEATHHLTTLRLYGGNRRIPTWVNEGIASFVSTVKRSGREGLDLSRVQRGSATGGGFIYKRDAEAYLGALQLALKKGTVPGLRAFLEEGFDERFYKGEWALYYGTSWALVHYLINADGGAYRRGFERWLLSEDGSTGDSDSLAAAIGKPLEEIDAALPAYIKLIR